MDETDKFSWFCYNEIINIAVTSEEFEDSDLKLFFGNQPVWVVHPQVTFRDVIDEFGLMEHYPNFGLTHIPEGYNENILICGCVSAFKICTYKPFKIKI